MHPATLRMPGAYMPTAYATSRPPRPLQPPGGVPSDLNVPSLSPLGQHFRFIAMASELIRYEAMVGAIQACHSVDEIKQLHSKFAQIEAAARIANDVTAVKMVT